LETVQDKGIVTIGNYMWPTNGTDTNDLDRPWRLLLLFKTLLSFLWKYNPIN